MQMQVRMLCKALWLGLDGLSTNELFSQLIK